MTSVVFIAVVGAAVLHALWNALVKGGVDKHLSMTSVVVGSAPFGCVGIIIAPTPDMASLPFLLCGIALHIGYQTFLLNSYRIGDLTQVYPIARGSAPLLVAGVSVLFLNVRLSLEEQIAVVVIGAGIMSLSFVRRTDGMRNGRATVLALGTGCFIAGYSLVDGLGARAAGTALGYFSWLTVGNALVFGLLAANRSSDVFVRMFHEGKQLFFIGGGASFIAYALVTWAFTQAPIALVTALRETSIVFALFIGVVFLKERLNLAKVGSTLVTLLGVALLRFARH
ncbi:MAG: DMT family transporter [Gammaproteobacteria bacterium]|nr:DMT family transporter [Gammaproteobacteria bacterium]